MAAIYWRAVYSGNSVHRVVIHDKPPLFERDVANFFVNRASLGVALASLAIQVAALVQAIMGQGHHIGWFDHGAFSVVALAWLALGVLVFLQRRGSRAGRMFMLSASFGSAFLALSTVYVVSFPDALLYAAGLLWFPPLLYAFTRASFERGAARRRELLIFVPPAFFLVPAAISLSHDVADNAVRLGLLLVVGYLLLAIVQTAFELFAPRTPEHTAQTRALLVGLAAGTVPGIFIFVVPLVLTLHTMTLAWLPPLILLFLLAMSYAVLLFEFTEADLLVRRGVVYGVLTLVILLAYGLLGVLLAASRASVTSLGGGLSFVVVTVLIGAAFGPITVAARRLVDWLLYGRRTDRWQLLQGLSARLATVMQPGELGEVLVRELTIDLHLRGACLLRKLDGDRFVLWRQATDPTTGRRYALPDDLSLDAGAIQQALPDHVTWLLLVHARPVFSHDKEAVPEQYRVLDGFGAALTIPLATRSGLEAILCLQPKLAHDAFDSDDLELLAPVVRQASAALDNALLFARLEEKVSELRDAYVRIARSQEEERARLARELHDGTAQELAGLMTLATVAERQMRENGQGALSTLDRLRRQAQDAYQGVRRASHALRPLMLDDFGLVPTLGRYLDQFSEATGIAVSYETDLISNLPDDVELALFRVAQECMENVRKHSGASRAHVRLYAVGDSVTLTVSDEGHGLPVVAAQRGIGLAGIRERIEALGGNVRVVSTPGRGVRIEAIVPLKEVA